MATIPWQGMKHMKQEFGGALRAMRNGLGLSQLQLAARLGTTQRHLSFLETGRSAATRPFLQRLCTELDLSAAQRSALFDASGFHNPFPDRSLTSQEISDALDSIECRILDNWPFPAFALNQNWTFLRANAPARAMFSMFGVSLQPGPVSLVDVVLSDAFRSAIANWTEASLGMYFRLQRAASQNTELAGKFALARDRGFFDHIPRQLTGGMAPDPLSPIIMMLPDGQRLAVSPFVGHLASIQDATLEGVEIEFMVPLDDDSGAFLRSLRQ